MFWGHHPMNPLLLLPIQWPSVPSCRYVPVVGGGQWRGSFVVVSWLTFLLFFFFVFSFLEKWTRFFQLPKRQRRPFSELFRGCNEQAVGLLERMLVFDPRERCTVDEALAHPYFQPLHDANEEPECKIPFDIQCERDYHGQEVPKDVIQNEVYRDMMRFHPEEKGMCDAYSNVKQQHRSKGGSRRK